MNPSATELLYLQDAYLQRFDATVVAIDSDRVALDATGFYVTGGGQPHDTGLLGEASVVDVTKEGAVAWHKLARAAPQRGRAR